jgi:hypothetical protein
MLYAMKPSLEPVNLKVERAKEHFEQLQSAVEAFRTTDPYGAVRYMNPKRTEEVVRARISKQPPPQLAIIIGDLLHNLRSALDHLVCQLVMANGKGSCSDTQFPICKERDEFFGNPKVKKSPQSAKVQHVASGAQTVIESLQPYNHLPVDDHPLYLLNRLNNRDKHRLLNLAVAAIISYGANIVIGPKGGHADHLVIKSPPKPRILNPIEDGTELYLVTKRGVTGVDVEPEVVFEEVFEKSGPGQGKPIVPTLQQLLDAVGNIPPQFIGFFS